MFICYYVIMSIWRGSEGIDDMSICDTIGVWMARSIVYWSERSLVRGRMTFV